MPSFFTVMLGFMILIEPRSLFEPVPDGEMLLIGLAGFLLLPTLYGLAACQLVRAALARPASQWSGVVFRRVRWVVGVNRLLILGGFYLFCDQLGWPSWLGLPAGLTAFIGILPFLAALCVHWMVHHLIESLLSGGARTSLAHAIRFNLRLVSLPVIGICLITALDSWLQSADWLHRVRYQGATEIAGFGSALLLFAFFPLLMRIVWPVEPIGAGALRSGLDAMVAANRVSIANILLWKTGPTRMMNACMIGLIPPLRYILITDALIERLDDHEIRAVFGHELCHAKRHHVALYGLFFASLFLLILPVVGEVASSFETAAAAASLLIWIVLFGAISRSFERECDLFGARAAGSYPAFVSALQKIAPAGGGLRKVHSFLHGSVPSRVAFLIHVEQDASVADRFQARITLIRTMIVLLFAIAVFRALAA